jgi:hypothetical protein
MSPSTRAPPLLLLACPRSAEALHHTTKPNSAPSASLPCQVREGVHIVLPGGQIEVATLPEGPRTLLDGWIKNAVLPKGRIKCSTPSGAQIEVATPLEGPHAPLECWIDGAASPESRIKGVVPSERPRMPPKIGERGKGEGGVL